MIHVDAGANRRVEVFFEGPFSSFVDKRHNTVRYAVEKLLELYGIEAYIVLRVWKGIPVSAGLGGSAASAVAGLVATAKALGLAVGPKKVTTIAGSAEVASAGVPHYDNAAASVYGGLVVIVSTSPMEVFNASINWLRLVVALPLYSKKPLHRKTEFMRKLLPGSLELGRHVADSSRLAALLVGLLRQDYKLLSRGFGGGVVEEARSSYVPCYKHVAAKLSEKARPIAISGAGPSLLTYCTTREDCSSVKKLIEDAYTRDCGVEAIVREARPAPGAVKGVESWPA